MDHHLSLEVWMPLVCHSHLHMKGCSLYPFRWNTLFPTEGSGVVTITSLKLTNGKKFRDTDKDHVLAVLSQ
jgi:hypothetical protein